MLDNPLVVKPVTEWHFTKPNKGWKVGIRMIRDVKYVPNNKEVSIQVQRWRTNKERNWVPTNRWFKVSLLDAKELFGELLKSVLEEYATQKC